MFVLDGLSMNSRIVKFQNKNIHCRVCGKDADIRSVVENQLEYAMNSCRIEKE